MLYGLEYASLPIIELVFPPGQPTVERAGPLLPALDTNTTLYLSDSSVNRSTIALQAKHNEVYTITISVSS